VEEQLGWVRIGVSPIISGGGVRMKNLYLGSTGRLVVTTPLGNEGIGYRSGEEAIVCEDGITMAKELNVTSTDRPQALRLGRAAAQRVRANFDSAAVWDAYRREVFDI
jgi:hypothetical protein